MTNRPLFVSTPAPDKFWREYRVYVDRVELETVLGVMTIPFDDIDRIAGSALRDSVSGEPTPSVVIARKQGWVRRVCIRPREPARFHSALEKALARHRAISPDH